MHTSHFAFGMIASFHSRRFLIPRFLNSRRNGSWRYGLWCVAFWGSSSGSSRDACVLSSLGLEGSRAQRGRESSQLGGFSGILDEDCPSFARLRASMACNWAIQDRPAFVMITALLAIRRLRLKPSMARCLDKRSLSAVAAGKDSRGSGLFATNRASAGLTACRRVHA